MRDINPLAIGMRYQRNAEPHDYVWASSQYAGRITIRTSTGWASIPLAQFEQEFTAAPKRQKKAAS